MFAWCIPMKPVAVNAQDGIETVDMLLIQVEIGFEVGPGQLTCLLVCQNFAT